MQNTMKTTKNSHIRTCSGYPLKWIPAINARMTVLSNVILGLVPGIHTSSVSLPMDSRNKCGSDTTHLMSSSGAHILSSSGLFRGSIMMALTVALGLSVASPAAAALDCSNGVGFTAKNGDDYCVSTIKMNWFSAFSWCKAAGGKLATLGEACPGTGNGNCTNIKGLSGLSDAAWLATPFGDQYAYLVSLSFGSVNPDNRNGNYYALCK